MATWSNGISLRGADGKSLRTGNGAPSPTYPAVQFDGDTYVDRDTFNLYGPRSNGQWPTTPIGNLIGPIGPASIVPVTAPPGPNVGVVGGFALWPGGSGNGNLTLLYGPKTSSGWPMTTDANGSSVPASVQLTGATGSNATLPKDFTPNSVAIAPISGDTNPSVLTQKNSSGATLFASDTSGNVTVAGTLNVAGKSTLAALAATSSAISGSSTVGGDLNVTGTATVGALTASATTIAGNQIIQGNDTVNGDLKVLGNTSLQALSAAGASTLAGVTATTLAASSNASVGGTLGVTGKSTLGQVASTSIANTGAVTVGTTLGVTGATTLSAAASVGADLTVAGTCQLKGINATTLTTSGAASIGAGLTVTGTVNPLGNLNVNNNALIQGTFTVSGTSSMQVLNAVQLNASQTLSVTSGSTLAAANCTSMSNTGNETVGGTLKVTGATTLAGVSATSINNSGNETVGGTLSVTGSASMGALTANGVTNTNSETIAGTLAVTGVTTLAAVNATNVSASGTLAITGATTAAAITSTATVTAKNVTLTSGGGGVLTFADGTTQATSAVGGGSSGSPSGSRTMIDMGSFYNTNVSSGALYGIYRSVPNAANQNSFTPMAFYDQLLKLPYAFSVTGYSLINAGTTSFNFIYYKNGSNIGSFSVPATQGPFAGGHTKGTYSFAAGDTFRVVVQPGSTTLNMQIFCLIEWT